MFLGLALLLASARIMGEVARFFKQPSILGEILAGIILGPTIFGRLMPETIGAIYPGEGNNAIALEGLTTLAIVLFLLVAGMEVDLSTIWRQGKRALCVGISGIIVPFSIGSTLGFLIPEMLGREDGADPVIFALFFATALSIVALPVIAKTLMDLNLYRSDIGMIVIAAAIFEDLVGWLIFGIILGMIGASATAGADGGSGGGLSFGAFGTILMTLGFAGFMLTIGRWLIHLALPWIQAHTSWPGGVLGFALTLALLGAAFTEWIGIHAIFGAFLVGVAIGDSSHLREQTRTTLHHFISFIFAPLFFASIGLKVDFIANFDLRLTLIVLVVACVGKIFGDGLGAKLSGMPKREALAIGFAMNARGAMEIILGLLALQFGIIGERLFVALVIMALVTSMMSGPMITYVLKPKRPKRFAQFMTPASFVQNLRAESRDDVLRQLSDALADAHSLDADVVYEAVLTREQIMSTALEHGIATPHARMASINTPLVACGVLQTGVDFNSADGETARIVFLILTPTEDHSAQVEILADIARTFSSEELRGQVLAVRNYVEFLAAVRSTHNGHD